MNASRMITSLQKKGEQVILEKETKEILEAAGIPVVRCHPVGSAGEAGRLAAEIGFPVVLKIASLHLLHKSEMGGVVLNLTTAEEVEAEFEQLLARGRKHDPAAEVILQQMAQPGVELIAGASADPHFGTVLMLGTGGIYTELLQDAVFRLPPLNTPVAREMISSLRGYKLLCGYRGSPPADIAALEDALLRLSDLVCASPEIKELDINPLVVYPRGVLALDARLLLK